MFKKTAIVIALSITIASAQNFLSGRLGLGLKVGSLGYGGEAIVKVIDPLNFRIGMNLMTISPDLGEAGSTEDYNMDATINLQAIYAVADYYPFQKSGFHLSGGLYISDNNVESTIHPVQTYTIGGDEYTPEKLGNIDMKLGMDGTFPYVGFGFGNRLGSKSGIGMNVDIGGYMQGGPKAEMHADGLVEPTAAPDQEELIEDSLKGLTWYPVISLGIVYKF
jgi:hypothetical protein